MLRVVYGEATISLQCWCKKFKEKRGKEKVSGRSVSPETYRTCKNVKNVASNI